MPTRFFAHSPPDNRNTPPPEGWQPLVEHLRRGHARGAPGARGEAGPPR